MYKIKLSEIIDTVKNYNIRENNKPLIFLVCIIIASVLWFIKTLGKEYETTVSVPVQYTNLPNGKKLVNTPPEDLEIKMHANGFTLLRHKLQLSVNPINFNTREFTRGKMEEPGVNQYKIATNRYKRQISKQISSEISVTTIQPDTLFFQFDQIVRRKKPIEPNLKLSFQNQYFLYDSIVTTPDSVWVTGSESLLDTLQSIKTKEYKFDNLNAKVQRNISLEETKGLEIENKRIVITIPVSQYTEYTAKLPITAFNVPDSLKLVTFPGKVTITCLVAIEKFENIDPSGFIFGINYSDIDNDTPLPVTIYRSPAYIKQLNYSPKQVEFIIEKD